jgi:hypothetical protein
MKHDNLFVEKKKYSKILKDYLKLNTKNKPTWLVLVKDIEFIDFLLDWLEVLPCDFVIKSERDLKQKINIFYTKEIKKDLFLWFDFMVWDNETEWLSDLFSAWITPILPSNSHLLSILKEFDPLNSEWNCFLYTDKNKWSMYYAIIRYLENYKFPYDNRTLVKNVISL